MAVPPKWGNWGGEDNQYTEFFEKTRKVHDPKVRQKVVNPNDPQQNPYAALALGRMKALKNDVPAKDLKRDGNFYVPENIPGARLHRSYVADSSNGGRSYDHSHKRGGSQASSAVSSQSNTSTPRHRQAARPAKGQHFDTHPKEISVPPFGGWKEKSTAEQHSVDPEEYSVIFDEVKKTRADAVSAPLRTPKKPAKRQDHDKKTTITSTKFKLCFCFAV